MLYNATTFYCCNLQVYLGRTDDQPEVNQGHRVVKELVNYWKTSGRNLTTDSFFTDVSVKQRSIHFLFTNQLTLTSFVPKK